MVADRAFDVLNRLRREADVARLRARNGIRLAAGRRPARSGITPKDVVWRHDRTELWRYLSSDTGPDAPVVLLVHSLVSRSYVLDLNPGSSLVGTLLREGADVFLLDWGEPDERDSGNTVETYVDDLLPKAVAAVREITGRPVHLVGYCLGGILALLYVARHGGTDVASLATLAAPVDFDELGMVVSMLRDGRLSVDDIVDESGNIPPDVFRQAFRLMQPMAEATQYVNLLQSLWNDEYVESHQAMSRWVSDHIPFPGGVARQLVDGLIRQNALAKGTLVLGGRLVDLVDVRCPTMCVLAERDHIVPVAAAEPMATLLTGSNCGVVRLPAGHVALVMGRLSSTVMVPALMQHFRTAQPDGTAVPHGKE